MRRTIGRAAAVLGVVAAALGLVPAGAAAALVPSPELSARVTVEPDSVTVGDPITLTFEAGGPAGASLLLPEFADSVGPFRVLSAGLAETRAADGRLRVRREVTLGLFRTGDAVLPPLAVLWPRPDGDTAVAMTQPATVRVGSVLEGKLDLANLKDVKKPVSLGGVPVWVWAAAAALLLAAAALLWARRRRRSAAGPGAVPEVPPLPPEVAFEQGLAALREQRLPERGFVREHYFELSLLFRRYLEGRFGFAAAEETRPEILAHLADRPDLTDGEVRALSDWLAEGDLVKFAKMERLLQEAERYTETAAAWVRRTAAPRPAPVRAPAVEGEIAGTSGPPPAGSGAAGETPSPPSAGSEPAGETSGPPPAGSGAAGETSGPPRAGSGAIGEISGPPPAASGPAEDAPGPPGAGVRGSRGGA